MTLPVGTISLSQVNTELGLASTTNISLNQANVRELAGVLSGTISMNDLRGKTYFALGFDSGSTFDISGNGFQSAGGVYTFYTNGQIVAGGSVSTTGPSAYGSPLTAGIGSGYEISLVISTYSNAGIGGITFNGIGYDSPQTTPWVSLSSNVAFNAECVNFSGFASLDTTGSVRIRKILTGAIITRAFNVSVTSDA